MTFLYVIVSFTGNDQAYLKILVEMIHLVGRPATVGRLATVKVGRPNVVGRPTTQSWATSDNFFFRAFFFIQIGRCRSHAPFSERPAPSVAAIPSPALFMI